MSASDLTDGAIAQMIHTQDPTHSVQNPICQILSVKKIAAHNSTAGDRYRIILSDGTHFAQAMLATQLRHMVEDGSIERNTLVRVTQYASNTVQNRRILILLGLDIFAPATAERLGNPVNLEQQQAAGAAGASAPAPGAAPMAVKKEASVAPSAPPANSRANVPSKPANTRMARPGAGPSSQAPVYPIEGLSPYQNKWTIKARVTSKSDIKHWSNQRGEGKLFSVNLLDDTGEIKATGFNDAVDRFHGMLQENHVYYISKARVNIAKKQFSNLQNEYEITFENNTEIEECPDADGVPEVKYDFVSIDQLDGVEPNSTCDVIGVVENVGDLGEIITKATQRPVAKRELTIVDQSQMSVRLTLWGKQAENFAGADDKPVIAFKGVKVGDFGGRSLSMFSSSTMIVNPDIPEAHGIRGWYDNEGTGAQFRSYSTAGLAGGAGAPAGGAAPGANLSERRTIGQVKDEGLGMSGEKPDYFNTRATVVYIKQENLYYTACPSDNCNKKVNQEPDGSWRCEKCDTTYPEPEYRYILAANASDHTGSMWLSGFNDIGELLIGMKAGELHAIKEENESAYAAALHKATNCMYMFNCRAKQDTFNDTTRVRYTVTRAAPVDFAKAGAELAEAIKAYM